MRCLVCENPTRAEEMIKCVGCKGLYHFRCLNRTSVYFTANVVELKRSWKCSRHCTLWKADRSPACRAVMMAVDAMNLSVSELDVNLDKGEHRSPELIAKNPQQTLPILQDRELVINDSHAIVTYLAARYCNCPRIMAPEAGGRAMLDQLMYYNNGVLQPRYQAIAIPILHGPCRYINPQQVCDVECAYADLEIMLRGKTWFGGAWPNLGDTAIASTVSTMNVLVPVTSARFPKLSTWLHRMSEQLFYITGNRKGLTEFVRRIEDGCSAVEKDVPDCPKSSLRRRTVVGENMKT